VSARRKRLAAAGVLLAGLVVAVVALRGGDGSAAGTTARPAGATAVVERRDLVARETVDGTLGYADGRTVLAAAAGTVTRLPDPGTIVRRGQALYELNDRPVALFYGAKPAWRQLGVGVEPGADVRQLEANLVALGYDPDGQIEVDGRFDWATRAAVARGERDRGVDADGVVELGDVAFLPGPRRVGELHAQVGGQLQPGAEVLSTSSNEPVVTVDLDATLQSLVAEGDEVSVELPSGEVAKGRIRRVGKVAEVAGGSGGDEAAGGGDETATIAVEITLTSRVRVALDQAPVDVSVEQKRVENALSVPVSALVALAGGGYAVELVTAGGTRLVAVETGAFADGYVQISGAGIRAGVEVVVPE
jgi:hypothetical protein